MEIILLEKHLLLKPVNKQENFQNPVEKLSLKLI